MSHTSPPSPAANAGAAREPDAELRAIDARFRSLITATSAIVWSSDSEGCFRTEQEGWSAFTGQSFAQLSGRGYLDAVHPDDRERTRSEIAAATAQGTMVETEHRLLRADGQYRHMQVRALAIRGDDGQVREWIGAHTDINERKGVEQRLRLLDAMSQAARGAVDAKSIMEVTTRLLGEHMKLTRCAYADLEADNDRFTIRHDWTAGGAASTVGVYSLDLFGSRATGNLRNGLNLVIHDVDRELREDDGAAMFNAIGIKAIICCPLVKEGRLVAMMAVHQATPRNWTGDDEKLIGEVVERSWAYIERVRAAEALREADQRKTEFLAILAHELRNPLAPIRNGLQVMRMAENDLATVRRVRDMMERQVSQMVHLVDDLLDISRITRGRFDLKPERAELAAVVAGAVETIMPQVDAGAHALTLDVPAQGLPLLVDPIRIGQVIGNVLHNASKYTPRGGAIGLKAWRDGPDAVIAVSDNGIGVPREALGSVFDMFAQVGGSIVRAQGGLGIGLSLSRRLVELHGGSIALESAGSGTGSTVTIRLPLDCAANEPAIAADGLAAPSANGANGLRVLVVDDNVDAAEMLSALLDIAGHVTGVANGGPEALALAGNFRPAVVFLDLGMPGMDGYEVARRLRQDSAYDDTVLVALTGWGDASDRARTHDAGFDHHLIKPAELSTVESLLATIAASGRQRA